MVKLRINMVATQDYYSQVLIIRYKKLKLKMSIKILATIKKCFTLAIIQIFNYYSAIIQVKML